MRFKFNKNKSQPEKITKYSIRKFHFGAASVAVASLLFFGNGSVQAADNVVSQATENQTVTGSGSNSSGGGGNSSGDSGSAGKPDASATTAAAQVTPTPTATTVTQPTTPAETEKPTEAPKTEVPSATTTPAEAGPSATSTTSNVGENEALSSNEQPAPATANEADNAEEKAAKEKVDVTALQTALTDLEDKLSKLKEESKKDSYKTLVTETKKVVDDHDVTKETADKQLELVKTAIEEVEKAIEKESEHAKEESNTPKKRGRKGAENPAPKEAPKALPTYTNGTDNYKLADEMRNIVTYLRKNGADAAKIAAIKENYDKLNEKLGLTDENAVLSEADFATALANLTSARNTIEAFLNKQSANGQPAVPGTERSVGDGLNRQVREAGKSFADSNEYYYEDGSTSSSSHYSKYTYLHHSMRLVGIADWNDQKVSDARKYFYANVTPTQDGFLWEVTVNSGHFDNYLTSSLWITTPDTQKVVANSIKVTKFGRDGQRLDTYDGAASTIEEQLRRAGLV